MNFEHFVPARDLFFLGALLFGAALGSFLTMLTGTCTLRQRSAWITAILFLLSFALASLAGAAIFSGGLVFKVLFLYPFVLLFFAAGALGLRLPRIGGFAIIIAVTVYLFYLLSVEPRLPFLFVSP